MTTPAIQPPEPIDSRDLIAAGRATLMPQPPATEPAPEAIRRAISTAYYAMFHALARNNADVLMDAPNNQLTAEAWIAAYRGLDHGHARARLQQNRPKLSADAQDFADLFCELQSERHNADYNPLTAFTAESATTLAGQGRNRD